jgi:hypothetical protein
MKPVHGWLIAALVLVIVVVASGWWLQAGREAGTVAEAASPLSRPAVQLPPSTPPEVAAEPAVPARDVPLPPLPDTTANAADTMSAARLNGDAREPALVRDVELDAPTAAELADPEAYQRYEARQNQRFYDAYVKAAGTEIPQIQDAIARARASGMSEEQIREGEEKLKRIQAMRDQIQAEHPPTATP